MWIIFVCFGSYILSLIFYSLYLIPVKKEKEKVKQNNKKIDIKQNKDNPPKKDFGCNEDEKEENIKYRREPKNRSHKTNRNKRHSKENENIEIKKEIINFEQKKGNNNNVTIYKNGEIIQIENLKSKSSEIESTGDVVKLNNSFPQNQNKVDQITINEIKEINISKKDNKKKKIYSTKICTLCGYIYVQKETNNKKACIIYYYTDKKTWCCEKLINFDVIASFFIELYCQICVIGYKPILTDKLLYEYSFSKNVKFYTAFFLLSLGLGITYSYSYNELTYKKEKLTINKKCNYLSALLMFLFGFTVFTFFSSIYY